MLGDKLRRLTRQIDEVAAGGVVDPDTWRIYLKRVDAIADQVDELETRGTPVDVAPAGPRPRPPARPSAEIIRLSTVRPTRPGGGGAAC